MGAHSDSGCSLRRAPWRSCGPPPPPGCGPHGPNGPIPNRGKPAAERPGLRLGGAALRQTAAGCCAHSGTNLSFNRFAGDTDFGPRLAKRLHERTQRRTRVAGLRGAKLRPAGRCATELTNNHNSHNRRQRIASIRAQIQNYIRAGACEGHARVDLGDASCGPSQGEAAARRRPCGRNSRFKIQDSKLNLSANHAWAFISVRAAACGGCNDVEELRASAAPRLRPVRS